MHALSTWQSATRRCRHHPAWASRTWPGSTAPAPAAARHSSRSRRHRSLRGRSSDLRGRYAGSCRTGACLHPRSGQDQVSEARQRRARSGGAERGRTGEDEGGLRVVGRRVSLHHRQPRISTSHGPPDQRFERANSGHRPASRTSWQRITRIMQPSAPAQPTSQHVARRKPSRQQQQCTDPQATAV